MLGRQALSSSTIFPVLFLILSHYIAQDLNLLLLKLAVNYPAPASSVAEATDLHPFSLATWLFLICHKDGK